MKVILILPKKKIIKKEIINIKLVDVNISENEEENEDSDKNKINNKNKNNINQNKKININNNIKINHQMKMIIITKAKKNLKKIIQILKWQNKI